MSDAKHLRDDRDKVVFRVFKGVTGGDVIALFPQISADCRGWHCQSYQHVGQHGAANYGLVLSISRPAKPHEYAGLKRELESIGYDLRVVRRASTLDARARRMAARDVA